MTDAPYANITGTEPPRAVAGRATRWLLLVLMWVAVGTILAAVGFRCGQLYEAARQRGENVVYFDEERR